MKRSDELMTIAASGTKEGLTKLINEFYMSQNWFINDDSKAENKKTGKIVGRITLKKNRYKFEG